MVYHWGFHDCKCPQISRTLLSILASLNNAVIYMVSTPLISKSFNLFNNPLMTLQSAPITTDIIVTFMFNSFFSSLARSKYLYFFAFFQFFSETEEKSTIFLCWLSLGLVAWLRFGDPFIFQNPRAVCAFHSPGRIPVWAYTACS